MAVALNIVLIYDLGLENNSDSTQLTNYPALAILTALIVTISMVTWMIWMISRFGISYKIMCKKADDLLP